MPKGQQIHYSCGHTCTPLVSAIGFHIIMHYFIYLSQTPLEVYSLVLIHFYSIVPGKTISIDVGLTLVQDCPVQLVREIEHI